MTKLTLAEYNMLKDQLAAKRRKSKQYKEMCEKVLGDIAIVATATEILKDIKSTNA
jgi:hypothetical protein